MTDFFVNFSNHPSSMWGDKQTTEAKKVGEIVDMGFPDVDPHLDEAGVYTLAKQWTEKILEYHPLTVLCQGESTLMFAVIQSLQANGIKCVAACSKRQVETSIAEDGSTVKNVVFSFEQFRQYAVK